LEPEPWQRDLARAVTDVRELLRLLDLDPADLPDVARQHAGFPLRVPRHFVGLMRRGDPLDPLLLQVLPTAREDDPVPGFAADPVGDLAAGQAPGLLQKYTGRALLLATGACAVHCRYCFRRHFPYVEQAGPRHWRQALQHIRERGDIDELILSGGDPLSLSDGRLAEITRAADQVPRLRALRIHTRLPVVLPTRITAELGALLAETRLAVTLVVHVNHPNELSPALDAALARLRRAVPDLWLLNQAVLLKSVNDDADTLVELSKRLAESRILPYYLHMLDPVAGAAHFDVPEALATALLATVSARLPGYLVPRLVRERPGEPGKSPVA
jgi:EF-P beta-lysylation protein EpmB